MDLEKTKNISKTYKFSIFKNLYTQNRKFENLGNFSFTSNVGSCCDSRIKNDIKNELRQKLAGWYIDLEEKKIFLKSPSFQFYPIRKVANSEIFLSFHLLQILILSIALSVRKFKVLLEFQINRPHDCIFLSCHIRV